MDRYSPADARTVLDAVSAEMASEIRKTFDFFSATSSEGPVDELVLSGGCALTPNLLQVLRDRFEVPTELMNPLRNIQFKESDFDGDLAAVDRADDGRRRGARHPQGGGLAR